MFPLSDLLASLLLGGARRRLTVVIIFLTERLGSLLGKACYACVQMLLSNSVEGRWVGWEDSRRSLCQCPCNTVRCYTPPSFVTLHTANFHRYYSGQGCRVVGLNAGLL